MLSLARYFADKPFESSCIHFINFHCKPVFSSSANNQVHRMFRASDLSYILE